MEGKPLWQATLLLAATRHERKLSRLNESRGTSAHLLTDAEINLLSDGQSIELATVNINGHERTYRDGPASE